MKKAVSVFLGFSILLLISTGFGVTYRLGLSPLKTEFEMYPGQEQTFELTLNNSTLAPVDYQLLVGSFELDADGNYIYLDPDQNYDHSSANWISLDLSGTNHVIVEAMQSVKLKVTVKVPYSVKNGGDYYAMIWANFVPPGQTSEAGTGTSIGVERRFRFGSILHVVVTGRPERARLGVEKIEVTNYDLIATSTDRGLRIDAFLKNSGDSSFRPTGDLLIVSSDNKTWGRMDMKMDVTDLVMPGLTRKMYALYDRTLPIGDYTAKINVKSGDRYVDHAEYAFKILQSTSSAKPLGINLQFDPAEIVSDSRSGITTMGKLQLYNKEFEPIDLNLSVVSLGMNPDGQYTFGDPSTDEIKLYPETFTLREDQKRVVPFSMRIPRDAEGQKIFAVKIRASSKESKSNQSTFFVPVMVRIDGTTKYAFEVTKTEKIIEKASTSTSGQTIEATEILRVWIKNTGNTFTNFNVVYDIIDPKSEYLTNQAQFLSNEGFTILPGNERYFDIPLKSYKLEEAGTYRVPLLLLYKGENNVQQQIKTEIRFNMNEEDLQKIKG